MNHDTVNKSCYAGADVVCPTLPIRLFDSIHHKYISSHLHVNDLTLKTRAVQNLLDERKSRQQSSNELQNITFE